MPHELLRRVQSYAPLLGRGMEHLRWLNGEDVSEAPRADLSSHRDLHAALAADGHPDSAAMQSLLRDDAHHYHFALHPLSGELVAWKKVGTTHETIGDAASLNRLRGQERLPKFGAESEAGVFHGPGGLFVSRRLNPAYGHEPQHVVAMYDEASGKEFSRRIFPAITAPDAESGHAEAARLAFDHAARYRREADATHFAAALTTALAERPVRYAADPLGVAEWHHSLHNRKLPKDKLPSLAFADYLEENGEPAKAAFIRRAAAEDVQHASVGFSGSLGDTSHHWLAARGAVVGEPYVDAKMHGYGQSQVALTFTQPHPTRPEWATTLKYELPLDPLEAHQHVAAMRDEGVRNADEVLRRLHFWHHDLSPRNDEEQPVQHRRDGDPAIRRKLNSKHQKSRAERNRKLTPADLAAKIRNLVTKAPRSLSKVQASLRLDAKATAAAIREGERSGTLRTTPTAHGRRVERLDSHTPASGEPPVSDAAHYARLFGSTKYAAREGDHSHAAFHAAIRDADYTDRLPSLVYADWLEEQGQTAHAEIVRRHQQRAEATGTSAAHVYLGPTDGQAFDGAVVESYPSQDGEHIIGVKYRKDEQGSDRGSRHYHYVRTSPEDAHRLALQLKDEGVADADLARHRLENQHPHLATRDDATRYAREFARHFAAYRAPEGGVSVKGLYYPGGQLVPDLTKFAAEPKEAEEIEMRPNGSYRGSQQFMPKRGGRPIPVAATAPPPKSKPLAKDTVKPAAGSPPVTARSARLPARYPPTPPSRPKPPPGRPTDRRNALLEEAFGQTPPKPQPQSKSLTPAQQKLEALVRSHSPPTPPPGYREEIVPLTHADGVVPLTLAKRRPLLDRLRRLIAKRPK